MTSLSFKVSTPHFDHWNEFHLLLTTKKLGQLTRYYHVDKDGSYYFYICLDGLTEDGHSLLQQLYEWKRAYRLHPDKPYEVSLLQPVWITEHRRWDIDLSFVR